MTRGAGIRLTDPIAACNAAWPARVERAAGHQRNRYRPVLSGLLIVTALLGLLGCAAEQPGSPSRIGEVEDTSGYPGLVRRASNYLLGKGSAIYEGDVIRTDTDARARLRMDDGSLLTIGGDSYIMMRRYRWGDGVRRPVADLTFTRGIMMVESGRLPEDRRGRFAISTPVVSMRLRAGTTMIVIDPLRNQFETVLLDGGPLELENRHGRAVLDTPGKGLRIVGGTAPQASQVWSPQRLEVLSERLLLGPGLNSRTGNPASTSK